MNTYGLFLDNNSGVIHLTGSDSKELLQRISTNDVLSLQQNNSCATILTNEKGRIIDVVTVYSKEQSLLLLTGGNNVGEVMQWINKFIIMEDVQLSDVSKEYFSFFVCGNKSRDFMNSFLSELSNDYSMLFELHSRSGFSIFRCLLPITYLPALQPRFSNNTLFDIIRIECGIPFLGKEYSAEFNPLEVGLSNYISFTKGCYIGQEVIARLDTYKKVQKELCGFLFNENSPENSDKKIYCENEEIGFVTSFTYSFKSNEWIALGYKNVNAECNSLAYSIQRSGGKIPVYITSLPF